MALVLVEVLLEVLNYLRLLAAVYGFLRTVHARISVVPLRIKAFGAEISVALWAYAWLLSKLELVRAAEASVSHFPFLFAGAESVFPWISPDI